MATTKAKAVLIEMANSLATEATTAGKTALATALTDFASEIDFSTDKEFFVSMEFDSAGTATTIGGKGLTYASILQGAAAVVQTKTQNTIADKASTVATNTTAIAAAEATIATQTTTIADKQTVIADKQTAMESYQKRLKELGETSGIRTITPTELVGMAKLYQTQIEQGKILDQGDAVGEEQQANARKRYQELVKKVEQLIKDIGPPSF